jgi:hypothetical protein
MEVGLKSIDKAIANAKAFVKKASARRLLFKKAMRVKPLPKKKFEGDFDNLECLEECVDVVGYKYLKQFNDIFDD